MLQDKTLALTPECIIVWPALFEPTSFDGSEEYFRAMLLIEKDADISDLLTASTEAARKKFPGQSEVFYNSLRKPIRDGMEKAKDEHGKIDQTSFYYNRYFINAKSRYQPQVVDIYNEPITDSEEVYGGCKVRAYLSFFGFDYMGNKGVSCSLRAVVKVGDGGPIGGGKVDTGKVFAGVILNKPTVFDSGELEDDVLY